MVDLNSLLDQYDRDPTTRDSVAHNLEILKCIRGGLRIAERNPLDFDPRREYWRLPERRFAVAYLANRWTGRFAPPSALRTVALAVVRHLDALRADGVFALFGTSYDQMGGMEAVCEQLAQHASRMAPLPDWDRLRSAWPNLLPTVGEDVAAFLRAIPGMQNRDHGFAKRRPWFAYCGCRTLEELRTRQAFFFGYFNLWTTTNAYVRAGAQAFAPVVQNTPTNVLLDLASRWKSGSSPAETRFVTLGRNDDDSEPQDRADYAAVVEVYGFLNLERAPFYNNRAAVYRQWFNLPDSLTAYELTAKVGEATSAWLRQHPETIQPLADRCRAALAAPLKPLVELETIDLLRARRHRGSEELLDVALMGELERAASEELRTVEDRDAAMIAVHLILDSRVYRSTETETARVPPVVVTSSPATTTTPPSTTALGGDEGEPLRLPPALKPYGEQALAFLGAGLHVLFAGPPGTGKTTLAQFVGYAWDRGLSLLPEQILAAETPLTTVGNSAWSPFHTIGGLMPNGPGAFKPVGGIFIDPGSIGEQVWKLRNGAIVLDEMNRADLDRCIGELYPLLSGSVQQVTAAGLLSVRIHANARFRVLATVNDSNLDDIVFPISEGLARRFQRIELPGGTREDILAFLGIDSADYVDAPRHAAAYEAVTDFIETARDEGLLVDDDEVDRLPFGVAYFAVLRAWVQGNLAALVTESAMRDQARELLQSSLRTLARNQKWRKALTAFRGR
jgi:hypothetical protein